MAESFQACFTCIFDAIREGGRSDNPEGVSSIRSWSLDEKVWLLDQSKSGERGASDFPAPSVPSAPSYLTKGQEFSK